MKLTVGFRWLGRWISLGVGKNRRLRRRSYRCVCGESLESRALLCVDAASLIAGVPGQLHFVSGVRLEPNENGDHDEDHDHDHHGGDAGDHDHDKLAPIDGHASAVTSGSNIAAATSGSGGVFTAASLTYSTLANGMPILHSLLGAPTAVYLDFDGDTTTATDPYSEDADGTTFNTTEQGHIAEAWRQMATYFAMFNTDVTTIQPDTSTIETAWEAVGNNISGGYSYVNVFPNTYPRSFNQSGDARTRVSGIAHEIGHNFGLQHQSNYDWLGNKVAEYSSGWDTLHGPIMGVDYAQSVHKWFIGGLTSGGTSFIRPSNSSSALQDDVSIISGRINSYDGTGDGFRPDDFGGTIATASALTSDGTTQSAAGIIERMSDFDTFSFTVSSSTNNTVVTATPDSPSALDIKLEIYAADGSLIAAKDGATNNQQLTLSLAVGTYYAFVSSHGDYGDLGSYTVTVAAGSSVAPPPTYNSLPAPSGVTAAPGIGTGLTISWADLNAGETGYRVERSDDGVTFTNVTTTGADVTSYSDNNLAGSLRYFYRVSAVDASGVSVPSPVVTAINRPSAVSLLKYMSLNTTTIVLNWRDTSGESGYRVERSSDNMNWTTLATLGSNVPGYTNSGLATGSAYYYRVTPTSAAGDGPSVTVQASTRLSAVTGQAVDSVTSNSVTLHWTDIVGETSYRIQRSLDNSTFSTLATVTANTTSYTDSTAAASTTYYYRVIGVNSLTESMVPTAISATTTGANPPTIVTAASASPSVVTGTTTSLSVLATDDGGEAALTYTWSITAGPATPTFSANGTNAAKSTVATFSKAGIYTFLVTVTDATNATVTSSVSVTVNQTLTAISISPTSANVVINATQQFTASGVDQFGNAMASAPSVTWSVTSGGGSISSGGLFTAPAVEGTSTVQASTGSLSSNTATITVIPATPSAPTNLSVTKVGQKTKLTWTDNALNETGFYVQYSTDGGATWLTYATVAAKSGTGSLSYTTGNLKKGTTYTFQIVTFNNNGLSIPSNRVTIRI